MTRRTEVHRGRRDRDAAEAIRAAEGERPSAARSTEAAAGARGAAAAVGRNTDENRG